MPAVVDKNRGPEVLAICCTGTAIAAIIVALRLWVRNKIVRKVGLDDWIVAASLVLSVAAMSCLITSVHNGLGRHIQVLTAEQSKTALKFLWIGFCITPSAEATAKISISLMLIRITTSARWKCFFYTLIVSSIMITIISLISICSCRPVELLWDPSLKGRCDVEERTVVIFIQGVMAALYDTLLAISPIFLLWKVQINIYKKMLLCGLLSLGFFTSVAGIIRTTYTPVPPTIEDPTWAIINFLVWKTVELPLSIIVGCLPTLRPLFDKPGCLKPRRSTDDGQPIKKDTYGLADHSGLTDQSKGNKTKQTTSISIDSARLPSEDSLPGHKTWADEDRV